MATVEALASGTPVVGTPVGATPEVLGPLDKRLLASSCEPEDLANAAEALMKDPDGLRRLGERSVRYARERYGWDRHMKELEEIYQSVLR
jgi:glycosyltransferase involved in cell wall biosynthesis